MCPFRLESWLGLLWFLACWCTFSARRNQTFLYLQVCITYTEDQYFNSLKKGTFKLSFTFSWHVKLWGMFTSYLTHNITEKHFTAVSKHFQLTGCIFGFHSQTQKLFSSFHLSSHNLGFHPQTQNKNHLVQYNNCTHRNVPLHRPQLEPPA